MILLRIKCWYFSTLLKFRMMSFNRFMIKARKKCSLTGEIVICAAVLYKNGKLIRGHRHDDCFYNANKRQPPIDSKFAKQGFITSQNRFVERKEAMDIQVNAGIKSVWTKNGGYNGDILFSEDLY